MASQLQPMIIAQEGVELRREEAVFRDQLSAALAA
jgi:hypothetical protein